MGIRLYQDSASDGPLSEGGAKAPSELLGAGESRALLHFPNSFLGEFLTTLDGKR